jgi:uncharacterized membrane protein (DUF2068 family)
MASVSKSEGAAVAASADRPGGYPALRIAQPVPGRQLERRFHQRLSDLWLRLIAAFKLVKGTFLLSAGIAALGLLNPSMAKPMARWAMDVSADGHYRVLDTLVREVLDVDPRTLRVVSLGSLFYALLFYTEGFGLYFDKRWAEYMTIFSTGGLIPFEVFEILRHASAGKIALLAVNVLIVFYLAWRLNAKGGSLAAVAES